MERHRFWVELIERPYGPNGAVVGNTRDQFETVVECRWANEGQRIVESQFGGPDRCRVSWRGPA